MVITQRVFQLYYDRNKYLSILSAKIRKSMQADLLDIKAKYNGDIDDEEEEEE